MLGALLLFQVALVAPNSPPGAGDLLPAQMGEWRAVPDKSQKFSSVEAGVFAPDADAAALDEFGFLGAQRREYLQEKGARHITVDAIRMKDTTGAFGAFTWYRRAGWREDSNMSKDPRRFQAAVGKDEAVLQRNRFTLHVTGAQLTHEDLTQLVAALPSLEDEPMPPLGEFLPPEHMVLSSAKYAAGPQVFQRLAPQLPAMGMGFHMGAEAIAAEYHLPGKQPMTLVLALYPTPQIAKNFTKHLTELNLPSVQLKRNGSLLMIVPDATRPADAEHLMSLVRYEMSVMWNQGILKDKQLTVPEMLTNIFALCGILLVFCAISGVVYGGIRVLVRRLYPDQFLDRDIEVIQLHLNG